MYDLIGYFTQVIKKNKKYLTFQYQPKTHFECYTNKIDKQVEDTLEWEFGPLKKPWLDIVGIKKLRF